MSDNRSCTCHPDEAPKPCQRHFGLSECFMAAEIERLRAALREIRDLLYGSEGYSRVVARLALGENK